MTTMHGYVSVGEDCIEFPHIFGHPICWNVELENWCSKNLRYCNHKDPFWAYVTMTKSQLLRLLDDVYGPILKQRRVEREEELLREFRQRIADRLDDATEYLVEGFDY